jgi:hypothetical protein
MNTIPVEIQKVIDRMKDVDPLDDVYSELLENLAGLVEIYNQIDLIQNGENARDNKLLLLGV